MDSAFWAVILGAVIAGTVSIGGELLRGWHDSNLDSAKRQDDRQIDRRRIQRDTILELQVAFGERLIITSEVAHLMEQALERGEVLRVFPEELKRRRIASELHFEYLTERVLDEGLRSKLWDFHAAISWLSLVESIEVFSTAVQEINKARDEARRKMGEVLRLYL